MVDAKHHTALNIFCRIIDHPQTDTLSFFKTEHHRFKKFYQRVVRYVSFLEKINRCTVYFWPRIQKFTGKIPSAACFRSRNVCPTPDLLPISANLLSVGSCKPIHHIIRSCRIIELPIRS